MLDRLCCLLNSSKTGRMVLVSAVFPSKLWIPKRKPCWSPSKRLFARTSSVSRPSFEWALPIWSIRTILPCSFWTICTAIAPLEVVTFRIYVVPSIVAVSVLKNLILRLINHENGEIGKVRSYHASPLYGVKTICQKVGFFHSTNYSAASVEASVISSVAKNPWILRLIASGWQRRNQQGVKP